MSFWCDSNHINSDVCSIIGDNNTKLFKVILHKVTLEIPQNIHIILNLQSESPNYKIYFLEFEPLEITKV